MAPRRKKPDVEDDETPDELTPDEEELEAIRCDRFGRRPNWAAIDQREIGGTVPPGWKI